MISKALRSLQCHFPFIRPLKFSAYNCGTRALGWPIEEDFKLLSRLSPIKLAVDIGGNWGQSIYALKRTAKPEKIISFEPNPVLSSRLAKLFKNDSSVDVEPVGLSDKSGQFRLFVPSYRGYIYDGLASLDFTAASEWLNESRIYFFDRSKLKVDGYDVAVKTLDDYEINPDVIKIDVQGLELQVIRGSSNTLSRSKPIVIVETPSREIVDFMGTFDLKPYRFNDGRLIADDITGLNTVFMHATRRGQLGI